MRSGASGGVGREGYMTGFVGFRGTVYYRSGAALPQDKLG